MLRLHFDTALADPRQQSYLDEPAIEKWPRAIRAAIVAGAALFLWSLIAISVWASIR